MPMALRARKLSRQKRRVHTFVAFALMTRRQCQQERGAQYLDYRVRPCEKYLHYCGANFMCSSLTRKANRSAASSICFDVGLPHDAAAHGILAGGLAHGLAVVVEGVQQLEQGFERMRLPALQRGFARGEVNWCGYGLEQRGGRGEDEEVGSGIWGLGSRERAQLAQHREPVAGGVERLAQFAVVGLGLGEGEDFQGGLATAGGVKQGDVLGEGIGLGGLLVKDQPDRGGVRPDQFRQGMGVRCRTNSGDPDARNGIFC